MNLKISTLSDLRRAWEQRNANVRFNATTRQVGDYSQLGTPIQVRKSEFSLGHIWTYEKHADNTETMTPTPCKIQSCGVCKAYRN